MAFVLTLKISYAIALEELMTMLLRQASVAANNYLSNSMVTSGDARVVAFVGSEAGKPLTDREVFVHDVGSGLTRSVSAINPALGDLDKELPSLSADGSKLAFVMAASKEIIVLDLASGELHFATSAANSGQPDGTSSAPSLSADGRYVAFQSSAANMVTGDANGLSDIFMRDLESGSTIRITNGLTGLEYSAGAASPQISADGKTVAFFDNSQVYAKDLATGSLSLVTSSSEGVAASERSSGPFALSADGRFIAFSSSDSSLVAGGSRNSFDVYRKELATGELLRIAPTGQGDPMYFGNGSPEISSDGSLITYVRLRTEYHSLQEYRFFAQDISTGELMPLGARFNYLPPWHGETGLSADGRFFSYVDAIPSGDSQSYLIRISSFLGDASLAPGTGNQTIEGGRDTDTLVYAGNRAEYQIAGGVLTDSQAARNGTDTLLSVDRLRFDDGNIALDIDGAAGKVYRLYQAALNRAPDEAGAGYWIAALDHGHSLAVMAAGLVTSVEFQASFGTAPTNAHLVERLYQNILHRPGEIGETLYWTTALDQGQVTLADVLVGFSESFENASLVGVIPGGVPYLPYG